jgi:group I intron endonuclease
MRGIYSITNTLTGMVYYGQSNNIDKRIAKHRYTLKYGFHRNPHLQAAWNKYGKDAFEFKPVEIVEDITIYLTPIEKKWFDSTTNKYNIREPENKASLTEEHIKRLSEAHKGKKLSEAAKKKLIGNKNAFGHKVSDEARHLMAGFKGKTHPEEWKENKSKQMKQYWADRKVQKLRGAP